MNLKTEYMESAIHAGRKVFRRRWGICEEKPLWIKFGKESAVIANDGKSYDMTADDVKANDWCIYGANESEQKMFMNELTWDDIFYATGKRWSV